MPLFFARSTQRRGRKLPAQDGTLQWRNPPRSQSRNNLPRQPIDPDRCRVRPSANRTGAAQLGHANNQATAAAIA
jgi:hypothetical protein